MSELAPIRAPRAEALSLALAAREQGRVPLIGDTRWSDEHWTRMLAAVPQLPREAAWASCTSGSTALPRVIVRTAASWEAAWDALDALLEVRDDDTLLVPVAPVSSLALCAVAHAEHAGLPWRVPAHQRVNAGDLAEATLLHATPSGLADVLDAIEDAGSHSLRLALIGGDRTPKALRARAELAGIRTVQYYGAAELSYLAWDADGDGLRAFPGVRLAVREGELWARTPGAALPLDAPTALRSASIQGHPWHTVGDLAELDASGRLHLRGRSDGAIQTAGATVLPEDIEATLRDCQGVSDALVTGVRHERIGTIVAAIVEGDASAETLAAYAREHLAVAQRPRLWFAGPIPRTLNGKPDRSRAHTLLNDGAVPTHA